MINSSLTDSLVKLMKLFVVGYHLQQSEKNNLRSDLSYTWSTQGLADLGHIGFKINRDKTLH